MFSVVSTKLLLFADDSQCFHRINHLSDCCLLQRDLDNLSDWADRCGMCFNTTKCAYMNFGHESHGYNYVMNSSAIPTVVEYKDVRVMLSPSLSFSTHMENIIAKAYRSLGLICRAVPVTCATNIKRTLYLTLIRSLVIYCCQIWRPYLIKESRALEKLQCRASKYIIGYPSLDYKQ